MSPRRPREIALLVRHLEEAFHRRTWHGTNLLGSLRGLDPATAAWRPAPGRHNIWELIVHTAYWKYAVTRRLTGGRRGGFPLAGSNFFPRPSVASGPALRTDIRLLQQTHADLLVVVAGLAPRRLASRASGSPSTVEQMVRGVANHDLYHAGQIQLLKRLRRAPG